MKRSPALTCPLSVYFLRRNAFYSLWLWIRREQFQTFSQRNWRLKSGNNCVYLWANIVLKKISASTSLFTADMCSKLIWCYRTLLFWKDINVIVSDMFDDWRHVIPDVYICNCNHLTLDEAIFRVKLYDGKYIIKLLIIYLIKIKYLFLDMINLMDMSV